MTYAKRAGVQPRGQNSWRITYKDHRESFKGSLTEARRRRAAIIDAYEKGTLASSQSETVEAYLERYIAHRASIGKLRPGQPENTYRGYVRRDVLPKIGSMKLSAVRAQDAQKVLDAMTARGLQPRSVLQVRAILHGAFRQAVMWRLIALNPIDGVAPPAVQRPKLTIPDATAIAAILHASEPEYRLPIAIAAACGLRRGEVVALRWGDLRLSEDGDFKSLRVEGTIQRVAGELRRMPPKSERGYRDVPIPPSLSAMLRRHKAEQAKRRLIIGEAWSDTDLIVDRSRRRADRPGWLGQGIREGPRRGEGSWSASP